MNEYVHYDVSILNNSKNIIYDIKARRSIIYINNNEYIS